MQVRLGIWDKLSKLVLMLLFIAGLALVQVSQGGVRVHFTETTDQVLPVCLIGATLAGMAINARYVIGQCRALRKRHISIGWREQVFVLASLIPWWGKKFLNRLQA